MSDRVTPSQYVICLIIISLSSTDLTRFLFSNTNLLSPNHVSTSSSSSSSSSLIKPHPLSSLLQSLTSASNREVILKRLSENLSCLDDFITSFASIRSTIGKDSTTVPFNQPLQGGISKNSEYGMYVRKVCLGFDMLSFEVVAKFYENVCGYRDEYLTKSQPVTSSPLMARAKTTSESSPFFSSASSSTSASTPSKSKSSSSKMKNPSTPPNIPYPLLTLPTLATLAPHLHHICTTFESQIGINSFSATNQSINELLTLYPECSVVHFLRYLNCLHYNEYRGALDSLHRYFDYATSELQHSSSSQSSASSSSNSSNSNIIQIQQQSLLNLAALYHHFGYVTLGRAAMCEAVRVCQQRGDAEGVAYSLAWLVFNGEEGGVGGGFGVGTSSTQRTISLLTRCTALATTHNLTTLAITTRLSLATFLSTTTSNPNQVWHTLDTAIPNSNSNVISTSYKDEIERKRLLARRHLIAAVVWEGYGNAAMAGRECEVALECYGSVMSSLDYALACAKVAVGMLHGSKSFDDDNSDNSDDNSDDSMTSVHEKAITSLNQIQTTHPHQSLQIPPHTHTYLLTSFAINQNKLQTGYALNFFLRSLSPLQKGCNLASVELHVTSNYQFIEIMRLQKAYGTALDLNTRLCCLCVHFNLNVSHAKLMLQRGNVEYEANTCNPTGALQSILTCISLCESNNINGVHALAISLLSKIHLQTGNWRKAKTLIKGCLPRVTESGSVEERGECWLNLAKCHILAKKNEAEAEADKSRNRARARDGRSDKYRTLALSQLDTAVKLYSKCDHVEGRRECYYLMALMYDEMGGGFEEERDETCMQFEEMSELVAKGRRSCGFDPVVTG